MRPEPTAAARLTRPTGNGGPVRRARISAYHVDDTTEARALDAQAQLARVGHHRLPPVDLLMAALADGQELGILHYDHDYDLLAEKTDLRFDSVWLAPRGTL